MRATTRAKTLSIFWLLVLVTIPILASGRDQAGADYASSWGPEVGARLPMLAAEDQAGKARTLDSLAGERGLLLFLARSADW